MGFLKRLINGLMGKNGSKVNLGEDAAIVGVGESPVDAVVPFEPEGGEKLPDLSNDYCSRGSDTPSMLDDFDKFNGNGGDINSDEGQRPTEQIDGYPTLDGELVRLYCELMKKYGKNLTDKLKKELDVYIDDNDLLSKKTKSSSIQEQFELSSEQFDVLVEVILLEREYNALSQDLSDLLGFLSEDIHNFEVFASNIEEFKQKQDELKGKISEFLSSYQSFRSDYSYKEAVGVDDASKLEEYPELGCNSNFIIYLSNIGGEIERTMNSNSGKGIQATRSVANKILTLCRGDYDSLRSKGEIHQIQVQGSRMNGQMLTDFNLAFERFGASCTTKVGYIRISLKRKNLELLRTIYKNNNLKYLMLVIAFGDFKNTDGSERNLFAHFSDVAVECEEEICKIVRIFSEEFTPESFEVAKSMIQQGVDITRSLKDNPEVSLVDDGNLRKAS